MSADEQAIHAIMPKWFDATRRENLDDLFELMTDDVEFLTPGRPPFGREQFAADSRANRGRFEYELKGHYREVIVDGSLAYARGQLSVTLIPKAGGPKMEMAGNTLSVFRKGTDGRWRLARDANFVKPIG